MTVTEIERAARRMRQKWYDLVMAEQQGCSQQVLERLYSSYLLAVEEHNRCAEVYRMQQERPLPVSVKRRRNLSTDTTTQSRARKRKVS